MQTSHLRHDHKSKYRDIATDDDKQQAPHRDQPRNICAQKRPHHDEQQQHGNQQVVREDDVESRIDIDLVATLDFVAGIHHDHMLVAEIVVCLRVRQIQRSRLGQLSLRHLGLRHFCDLGDIRHLGHIGPLCHLSCVHGACIVCLRVRLLVLVDVSHIQFVLGRQCCSSFLTQPDKFLRGGRYCGCCGRRGGGVCSRCSGCGGRAGVVFVFVFHFMYKTLLLYMLLRSSRECGCFVVSGWRSGASPKIDAWWIIVTVRLQSHVFVLVVWIGEHVHLLFFL
mmetsp:Transcript_19280/g.30582  ORF Transcript_19280/g.30582 Transcript_19280/m.30582 type:complete len:280 (+) Transcript_19280:768-1607(+)